MRITSLIPLVLCACGAEVEPIPTIERLWLNLDRMPVWDSGPAAVDEPLSYRWSTEEIAGWSRREEEGIVTLISPELGFESLQELHSIELEVADFRGRRGLTLHWNDQREFAGSDGLRQLRELTANADEIGGSYTVRGHDITDIDLLGGAAEEKAPRFLFLRFPPTPQGDPVLDFLEVRSTAAMLAERPSGGTRLSVAGEIRDAFFLSTPGALQYLTDLSRPRELVFGLHHEGGAGGVVEVTLTLGEGESWFWSRRVPASKRWQDFRISLPASSSNSITLRAESDPPGTTLYWANPMLITENRGERRPNVIIYVLDALRAEQLSVYGYERETTPFLESIAPRSVIFTDAYSPVSWTKPSVVTLLTSLYPQVHGIGECSYTDALPESVTTLQDVLRENGYVTAHFSANPLSCTLSNLDQGFDQTFTPNAFRRDGRSAGQRKVSSDALNAEIFPWLEAHRKEPFFLYVHSVDPHEPFTAPEGTLEPLGADPKVDGYDAEIRFNDGQLRRLHEKLTELDLTEDTLLVVTADHGESFGEHGLYGHGTNVYQDEVRIPLILFHPGRLAPERIDEPVQLIDLMPTLLTYLDIDFDPGWLQGSDVLDREARGTPRQVFLSRFVYPEDMNVQRFNDVEYYSVIEGGWKLIVSESGDRPVPGFELYDLAVDPEEERNLGESESDRIEAPYRALKTFIEAQSRRRAIHEATHRRERSETAEGLPAEEALEQLRALGYGK